MSAFRASLRLASKNAVPNPKAKSAKQAVRQHLAARASARDLPTIPKCPTPSCDCAEMPSDLDIEMERKLEGTAPAHSEHVIISTGQADWKSRIEDEQDSGPWGEVVSTAKALLGPKGRLHDVRCSMLLFSQILMQSLAISERCCEHILLRRRTRPTTRSPRIPFLLLHITGVASTV